MIRLVFLEHSSSVKLPTLGLLLLAAVCFTGGCAKKEDVAALRSDLDRLAAQQRAAELTARSAAESVAEAKIQFVQTIEDAVSPFATEEQVTDHVLALAKELSQKADRLALLDKVDRTELEYLASQMRSLYNEIESTNSDLESVGTDIGKFRRAVDQLDSRIVQLEADNSRLDEALSSLRRQLSNHEIFQH